MRRALLAAACALSLSGVAAPALAGSPYAGPPEKKIASVPVCDLEGHCDRHCAVWVSTTAPLRCGYGPGSARS